MDSFTTNNNDLTDQTDDYVARPKGTKYPRRGACVFTTLYQSANIAAYEDYCAAEIFIDIPEHPTSPMMSYVSNDRCCNKRSADREDESEGEEGARDIKRRGSVDR